MEHHPCQYEEKLMEMYGDIKTLVSEFKAMNGSLREYKVRLTNHEEEAVKYRRWVDIMWGATHTIKWAIILVFGTGTLWKVIEMVMK